MSVLDTLVAVIPMLGTLIFAHELGHFLVAKACGVRVLKFSLGFGPPIGVGRFRLRWLRSGTEYVIAWFPLGGFVKMLGEQLPGQDGEEEPEVIDAAPDEYLNAKRTWQKLAITFAGPGMNLLLPVVAFVVVLWVGIPKSTSVVGLVEPESPAALAGIRPGDRLVSVEGESVRWWRDVEEAVRATREGALHLEAERGDELLSFSVPVVVRSGLDEFGGVEDIGWIGVGHRRLSALLGVAAVDSPAALAGLRSGDRVVELDGRPVEDWEQLRALYAAVEVGPVEFEVARGEVADAEGERRRLLVPALGDMEALGVISAAVLVGQVTPGMPADRAGLVAGDLILAVDGRPVGSFETFAETVRASRGRPLGIAYARDGAIITVSVSPELKTVAGPLDIEGMDDEIHMIGISPALATLPGDDLLDRVRNPFVALPRAVEMTVDMTVYFLSGLGKLLSGEVGADKLAGPIGIAEIARKSLDLGWQVYLSTMIFISINLGILNLLPIPILDGGQALIYAVEGIKRSPISLDNRARVQQVGLTMLVLLMGLAFWNDLSRHWDSFVEWLSTGL
jgi:regulator of sigma E protease